MCRSSEFISAEGLAFSGRVTASVSHELKNALATMSETAGLLTDILELSESGRPLDIAELRGYAENIVDEVGRGFRVIKNLNLFAHSTDNPVAEVDLDQLIELTAGLASYLSYAAKIDHQRPEDAGPKVMTRPILLEDLVYRCFVYAFRAVGPKATIQVATCPSRDAGSIIISGLRRVDLDQLVTSELERIMKVLHASVQVSSAQDEIRILVSCLVTDEDGE